MTATPENFGFDYLMQQGQVLHGRGQFEPAMTAYATALGLAPSASEQGRAMRGLASGNHRLGNFALAEAEAERALAIHQIALGQDRNSYDILRELPESASVYGRIMLSGVVDARLNGREVETARLSKISHVTDTARRAYDAVELREEAQGQPDQRRINTSSYFSFFELVVNQDHRAGRRAAAQAIRLAFRSESPKLPTSNHELSFSDRMRAKARHLARGVGALAANSVAPVSTRTSLLITKKLL